VRNWCLEVWGDYACFSRPEMKVERVSYDVMTPSVARAIFEAVLWKPAIRWHITKIEVLNPIKWASVRRNEVENVAPMPTARHLSGEKSEPLGIVVDDSRQQRASLILKDVKYRIYAYFQFTPPDQRKAHQRYAEEVLADEKEKAEALRLDENEAKYAAMFERRARKGQCFHRPYLGTREFACDFRLIKNPIEEPVQPICVTKDLGFMLYDMDFDRNPENPKPLFFRAYMENGVINTNRKEIEVRG